MTDNFDLTIKYEHGTYYLSTTRNGYQWTSIPINTSSQMRQIAAALTAKADEIEKGNEESSNNG